MKENRSDKELLEELRRMKRELHYSASIKRRTRAIDHGYGYFSLDIPSNRKYNKKTNTMNLLNAIKDTLEHAEEIVDLLEYNEERTAADEFKTTLNNLQEQLHNFRTVIQPEQHPNTVFSLYGLSLERTGGVVMYSEDADTLLRIAAEINNELEGSYDKTGDRPAQVVPIKGQTYEDFKASAAEGNILRVETGFDEPIYIIQPWAV